ncbi:MAG: shikimate kinase AroK [Cocleimonas sp.]|nr:shikimate kinase AroK [Cocleimonas sp.]
MKKNIVLVGLMGAGKSTVGRHLAKYLKMELHDSDSAIQARTGVNIATIFEIEGEQGFRVREEQMIAELSLQSNIILATGGGSVLSKKTRNLIQETGHVIYLSTTAEQLYARIRHDKSRPLMQTENPLQTLRDLLKSREPYYLEVADSIIKTGREKIHIVCKKILKSL